MSLFASGCSSKDDAQQPAEAEKKTVVALQADTNRDGVVDDADTAKTGAIFLANIDDDMHTCPLRDPAGKLLGDVDLAKCNDAQDDVVNGEDDALDLAPLRTVAWPDAPEDATATLTTSSPDRVRLFRKTEAGWTMVPEGASIARDALVSGIQLGIEAKDIVRDAAAWSGSVDVTFHVTAQGIDQKDSVTLQVAPVLLQHHSQPVERLFVTKTSDPGGVALHDDVAKAFPAVEALTIPEEDQWTQDFFEAGYMSMPAAGSGQHAIRVVFRSANLFDDPAKKNPLRAGGRIVFTTFRGKDVAGIQEFDPSASPDMDSLNSFGNTETIPPYTHGTESWPLGRIIRGSVPSFHPDARMELIFDAQKLQKPLFVDTSWLLVGHVDETLSFLPDDKGADRKFRLLANDPRLAKKMLEDLVAAGHGDAKLFVDRKWVDDTGGETPADKSVADILADADIMAQSQAAAAQIDGQIATIKDATGLADDEIVPVPFLHEKEFGASIAYQPGTVNGVMIDATHFASPKPHGPTIDGKDPFETQLETALGARGVTVTWVEDWDLYHRLEGEVHCGSNVFRAIPKTPWWEVAK